MAKRSDFEPRENDFYPTPFEAVPPLIPYLRGIRTFAEPCAGEGDLIRHLESFGLTCVYAGDITTGQDALARASYGAIDAIVTNPPFSRKSIPLLRRLIAHFQNIAPTWLLLRLGMASTIWMAPLLRHCSDIVVMPRLILIKGTTQGGMEDHAWYRFDINHTAGPVLHNNRGKGEAIAPQRTRICEQCRKPYQPQRSTSRFCSQACKQQAYRRRLNVTPSVTPKPNAAIEPAGTEVFRYVRHADVPRFTVEGWQATPALDGTHHGEYSVLMRRIERG
jgi:hypothetical protein